MFVNEPNIEAIRVARKPTLRVVSPKTRFLAGDIEESRRLLSLPSIPGNNNEVKILRSDDSGSTSSRRKS
ncbi:hypothetical protein TNCT_138691 [Trichonephila clavata]|uniref:Uncharacterized protein n=1 Tax=Trichonephila clavata TaxID=2740835 RepID=A0A8X6GWD6_TRICU|nr:hypothetical protein TNCT_138691 [Trichonephila clavata]